MAEAEAGNVAPYRFEIWKITERNPNVETLCSRQQTCQNAISLQKRKQMRVHIALLLLILLTPCYSQELTVLNVPPASLEDVELRSNTVINLIEGSVSALQAGSENRETENLVVNVLAGAIVDSLYAYSGATVNVSGGTVDHLYAREDSEVNLFAGAIGRVIAEGSDLNLSGGTITGRLQGQNARLTVTGGGLPSRIILTESSILNIEGRDFETRLRTVAGTLVDGSRFEFATRSWEDTSIFSFVTVPEPSGTCGFAFWLSLLVMKIARAPRTRIND